MIAFLALLTIASAMSVMQQQPPVWPAQFHFKGRFDIPNGNLSEPLEVWSDSTNNRLKISYYDGMDEYTWRYDLGVLYQVVPRVDTMICIQPQLNASQGGIMSLLPDLSVNWTFQGERKLHHKHYNVWRQIIQALNRTFYYDMYLDGWNQPHVLVMYGEDYVFGSHPDLYLLWYGEGIDSNFTADVFSEPAICQTNKVTPKNPVRVVERAKQQLGLLQTVQPRKINDEFDLFSLEFKKYYFPAELEAKRKQFFLNKKLIEQFNAKSTGHKLAINHYADLTEEEMKTIMRPQPTIKRSEMNKHFKINAKTHKISGKKLPNYVNWIEAGAVTPVKDQGACGSCWTFGTTGALEGAYAVKTGKLISMSEQQIVDCAWVSYGGNGGDSGCDGGFAAPAMQWVMDNGGIATEQNYPYLMQDHWCTANDTSAGIKLAAYVNVTSGDQDALLDAVAMGPVAIAIDASHPTFTFYTSGVYADPACQNDLDSLDHEVLIVGYGTDQETGLNYWLVKNSWSHVWGDQGFVKILRDSSNMCGVATQATYATF